MKKFLLILLAAVMIFSFAACGGSKEPAKDEGAQTAAEESVNQTDNAAEDVGGLVELNPSSKYEVEGKFVLNGLQTEILSDASVKEGWYYYYSEGTGEKVPALDWEKREGMHTSCEIFFDMTNLEDKMTKSFVERCQGLILYNPPESFKPEELNKDFVKTLEDLAAANEGTEVFKLTPLQSNPKQTDLDGYTTRSLDAVLLGKDETAKQVLLGDVSDAFYKSWENSEAKEEMWAYFTYGDDVIFAVNLRTWMKDVKDEE